MDKTVIVFTKRDLDNTISHLKICFQQDATLVILAFQLLPRIHGNCLGIMSRIALVSLKAFINIVFLYGGKPKLIVAEKAGLQLTGENKYYHDILTDLT